MFEKNRIALAPRMAAEAARCAPRVLGLTFLGPIFWLILGFGSAKYVAEQPAQA